MPTQGKGWTLFGDWKRWELKQFCDGKKTTVLTLMLLKWESGWMSHFFHINSFNSRATRKFALWPQKFFNTFMRTMMASLGSLMTIWSCHYDITLLLHIEVLTQLYGLQYRKIIDPFRPQPQRGVTVAASSRRPRQPSPGRNQCKRQSKHPQRREERDFDREEAVHFFYHASTVRNVWNALQNRNYIIQLSENGQKKRTNVHFSLFLYTVIAPRALICPSPHLIG